MTGMTISLMIRLMIGICKQIMPLVLVVGGDLFLFCFEENENLSRIIKIVSICRYVNIIYRYIVPSGERNAVHFYAFSYKYTLFYYLILYE